MHKLAFIIVNNTGVDVIFDILKVMGVFVKSKRRRNKEVATYTLK